MFFNTSMTVMLLTLAHHALRRQIEHNRWANINGTLQQPQSEQPGQFQQQPLNGSTFDFIIVGGGTTGLILANRLSNQLRNSSILVLEAGGPQSIITDMIGNTQYLIGGEFDWNYHVERQQNAGQSYPMFSITRGKVLGGTSTTQWGIYNRGNPKDFNINWSQKYNLTRFDWPHVLPYFLRFENNSDQTLLSNGFHSQNGPISISSETKPDQILLNYLQMLNQHYNLPMIDLNNQNHLQYGSAIAQMFYDNQTAIKSTTANSYIEMNPNQNPNNQRIKIITRAMVERILFDSTTLNNDNITANSVLFRMKNNNNKKLNGQNVQNEIVMMQVYARQEILICAGPINTPQLLMLSGIGPESQLNQFGIPLIKSLPGVGENLHDMLFVPLYYRIDNSSSSMALIDSYPRFDTRNLFEYFHNHNGPLAHHADGVTYFDSYSYSPSSSYRVNNNRSLSDYWPNTMIISVVEYFNDLNGTVSQYINNTDKWYEYWRPYSNDGYYLAIDPVLARPKSRGFVRLNPRNPLGPPLIDPRYLSDDEDFQAIFNVTKFAVESLQYHPLNGLKMFPPIPDCPQIDCQTSMFLCETYLKCHIRQLSRSYYNFAGTCRMGKTLQDDPMAVVDENFRVFGVNNLRIIDESIIPEIPNGHITATTIMLGEMASDIIINDHQ